MSHQTVLAPSNLLAEPAELLCAACGRDVLSSLMPGDSNRTNANMVVIRTMRQEGSPGRVLSIYVCCKGSCDSKMQTMARPLPPRVIDLWSDVDDLLIPIRNLQQWIDLANELAAGVVYEEKARKKLIEILCATAPFVTRNTTEEEQTILEKQHTLGL